MTTIRAVLFDYGMVLSGPPDPLARERMQKLLHSNAEDFHKAYWEFRDAYDRGTLRSSEYWRAVSKALKQPITDETLVALDEADIQHWAQPNEPMITWALALQQKRIKTGVLSNIGDAMEIGIRKRFSWMHGFSHFTFSHRLRIAKPDLAIYQHAAEGLETSPREILFIDDREENILAAKASGMIALLYTDHAHFKGLLSALGETGLPHCP